MTQVGSVAETSLLHQLSSMAYAFQQNGGRERGWGKMYCFCFCLFVCFSFCLSLFVFGYGYFAFAFLYFVIFTCFFVLLFCCSLFVFAFGYFAFALLYFITTNLLQRSLNNLCKTISQYYIFLHSSVNRHSSNYSLIFLKISQDFFPLTPQRPM